MLGAVNNQPNSTGSALAIKGPHSNAIARGNLSSNNSNKRRGNRPWCDHCKRMGHTKETCWKLHGKLVDWRPSPRPYQHSQGNIATTEAQPIA